MSLAGPAPVAAEQTAVNNAFNSGVTLFAAAGNEYSSTIMYPAGYSNVIGVGATDNQDHIADFSNHNSTVDLAAPGVDIYSTMPTYPVNFTNALYPSALNYDFMSGTSMATPMAAGVATLALSRSPGLTPAQVEQVMEYNADDLGAPWRDDYFGYGRVNAFQVLHALTVIGDTVAPSASISGPVFSTNLSKTRTFKVSWSGSDPTPSSGIASYDVQYKLNSGGAWTNWKTATAATSADFKGKAGKTYYFRVRAKDKVGNTGAWSTVKATIVPYDNNSLIYSRRGFGLTYRNTSSGLYLGSTRYSTRKNQSIVYAFKGRSVALVATKAKNRSKAKIYVDGKYNRTVDTHSASRKFRRVVFARSFTKRGAHKIKIVNVGNRKRLDLDGLAVGR